MLAKAPVSRHGQEGQVLYYADMAFMAGLVLMILTLPISEALKNAGYFLALGGWVLKRAAGRGFRITFTPIGAFLSLYFLTSLVSAAFALDRWEGFRGAWDVFRGLSLFLMILNEVDRAETVRFYLWLFVASTGIGVFWGLGNYIINRPLGLEIKSLGHTNHTAWYLVIMLALLISLLLLMDWPVQAKMAVGVITGATFLALYFTYSRGAWITFFACLLFFSVSLKRWKLILVTASLAMAILLTYTRRAWITLFACLLSLSISLKRWKLILVVASLAMASLVTLRATGRLGTEHFEVLTRAFHDDSLLERFGMWRGSIMSLQDRPLLGVGPRNFKNLDHERYGITKTNHAHSLFFTVMVERGILGFLSLLALFACYLSEGIKRRRAPKDALGEALWHAAMGSFIAIVVAGMFNTTLHSEGAIAFWSLTALMLAPVGAAKPSQEGLA